VNRDGEPANVCYWTSIYFISIPNPIRHPACGRADGFLGFGPVENIKIDNVLQSLRFKQCRERPGSPDFLAGLGSRFHWICVEHAACEIRSRGFGIDRISDSDSRFCWNATIAPGIAPAYPIGITHFAIDRYARGKMKLDEDASGRRRILVRCNESGYIGQWICVRNVTRSVWRALGVAIREEMDIKNRYLGSVSL
jgi:hypothetical protein